MTETSPLATVGGMKAVVERMPLQERLKVVEKAGRPHILVDMRIVNDNGEETPHDGKSSGSLQVRGPMVLQSYYKVTSCNWPVTFCPAIAWQDEPK